MVPFQTNAGFFVQNTVEGSQLDTLSTSPTDKDDVNYGANDGHINVHTQRNELLTNKQTNKQTTACNVTVA